MTSKSFTDFKFNKQLLDAIAEAGYGKLTPVQEKVLGPVLSGQDLIGIAPTGTGKTATYVLPLLRKLNFPQGKEVRALVLAPTRELAVQIGEHIAMLGKYTGLRSVVIYGGVGPQKQIAAVEAGLDILVATPGRFMDIYLAGHLPLKKLQFMVIDEADKMMDMGFRPAINRILEVVPRKRQNLLFSATFHPKVEGLAGDFLKFPVKIEVEPQSTPASEVRQAIYYVPNFKTKLALLMYLLEEAGEPQRTIIFCKTKQTASNIGKYLVRKRGEEGVRVVHGNKAQNTRMNAVNDFREGKAAILVATDVVSRGIDISGVSHVINFDIPLIYEDYVHRIGRTGRMLHEGAAGPISRLWKEYGARQTPTSFPGKMRP
ncbi:MAG TPA: DEAD/DEAH box helicase, partial [Anseongella sp.]|nr:DEAD/DEAH box helicase [Anseongella sp.]